MIWAYVAFFAIEGLATVAFINKPREPITPGFAAFCVAIWALLICGLFYV